MSDISSENKHDLTILLPAIRQAGAEIMAIHARGVTAELKQDRSPVTEADKAAERILLAALAEHFPDIPVISEENPDSHKLSAAPCYFLVDPLDGTREFLRADSSGAFTVNIGLIEQGRASQGTIYAPAFDRLCWTVFERDNLVAYQDDKNGITALKIRALPLSGPVAVASRSHLDPNTCDFLTRESISETLSIGSSLKFLLLADGQADIYPRYGPTMEWDTAAGEAILRAAGGTVLSEDGRQHVYGKAGWKNGPFIACAGYLPHSL